MAKRQNLDHFLPRYLAGEHEAVWAELIALGSQVRKPPYFKDARAVAAETMRRSRHNFELLIRRLDSLKYRFEIPKPPSRRLVLPPIEERIAKMRREQETKLSPKGLEQLEGMMRRQDGERRAKAAREAEEDAKRRAVTDHLTDKSVIGAVDQRFVKRIPAMEKKGFILPLALRAWIEEVGHVCLIGAHPTLSFFEGGDFPGVYADPFMMLPDLYELEGWLEEAKGSKEMPTLEAVVGWTAQAKARLAVADEQLDYGYAIALPDPAADAQLLGERHGVTFVEYLRIVFRWGGFPGWEQQEKRPEQELGFLTDGLLPI